MLGATPRRLCLLLAIVAAHAGCRLTSSEVTAVDAGETGGVEDAAQPDAGAAAPVRAGNSFLTLHDGDGYATMRAQFWAAASGPGSCSFEEVAGCRLSICEQVPDGPRPHAGDIAVSSPVSEGVLVPGENGGYPLVEDIGAVTWSPGDEIEVAAAGGEVPAFQVTLIGPPSIDDVLSPDLDGDVAVIPVPRDQPFLFEWAGADEAVVALATCQANETTRFQARCELSPGANAGVIPPEALARLPAGCTGDLWLTTEAQRLVELDDGGWLVRVHARGPLFGSDATFE